MTHRLILPILAAGLLVLAGACASDPPPADRTPELAPYACPMHPNVVQAEPGRCPLCGMELQAR